jgi:hypothetical protein
VCETGSAQHGATAAHEGLRFVRAAASLRHDGGACGAGMAETNVSHTLQKMMAMGRVRRLARDGYRVPYELVQWRRVARDDEMMR